MNEGVVMHENLNAVDELIKVNSKQTDKNTVFNMFKERYNAHFAKNDEFESKRQQIC